MILNYLLDMSEEDKIELQNEDLSQLELQLDVPPILDYLAVFVRDPENSEQYWLRKIHIDNGSKERYSRTNPLLRLILKYMPWYKEEQPEEVKGQSRVEIQVLDLSINNRPCPKSKLDSERLYINKQEQILRVHSNPEMRELHAVVGVAEYLGSNTLTLDDVINLAGMKYHHMRAAYLS